MKIHDLFKNPQKKVFIISFTILLISILSQFITSCIWISRLLPYYVRAEKSAKNVYNFVIWTMIFSILDFIYIIVVLVFFVFCKNQCQSCIDQSWKIIGNAITMIVLLLLAVVIGVLASSYGLEGRQSLDNRCFKYVYEGYVSLSQYIYIDQDKFIDWITKYEDHATNDLKYFCESVGIPTFLWSFFQFLACITMIFGFIMASKNPSVNDSTNEEDEISRNSENAVQCRNTNDKNDDTDIIDLESGVIEDI